MKFLACLPFTAVLMLGACSYDMAVQTDCYIDGELAYTIESKATSSFGATSTTSATNYTYMADWYDPAEHGSKITCTSASKSGWS